jgi:uncharacterized membrane protein
MAAVTTVTVALALYTVGTIKERRARRATPGVRGFLAVGVGFDVTATALMIIASRAQGITVHGLLGYSALAMMAADTLLVWRHGSRRGGEQLPARLHRFSLVAYLYWVIAYFTGAALVMMANR